jgi:hypothetical protein
LFENPTAAAAAAAPSGRAAHSAPWYEVLNTLWYGCLLDINYVPRRRQRNLIFQYSGTCLLSGTIYLSAFKNK